MDLFLAVFVTFMILGLCAVALPSYWLVQGWWQDRVNGRAVASRLETINRARPFASAPSR